MFGDFCLICSRRMGARWNFSASLLYFAAFLLATSSVATADPPLPRERPEIVPGERFSAPELRHRTLALSDAAGRTCDLQAFAGNHWPR